MPRVVTTDKPLVPAAREQAYKRWRDTRVGWAWHGCAQALMPRLGLHAKHPDGDQHEARWWE